MKSKWDVIVVGAGPSGLACASAASEQGLQVLLLDEQPSPGGQIYRNINRQPEKVVGVLGKEYQRGFSLISRFGKSKATYLPGSTVWKLEHDGRVCFSRDGVSSEVQAKRVVIATGAMERPTPFKGWTLPGIMGAGAVDAMLKSDGVIPTGPVTMVGSGPIMLLVAGHLNKLGVEVSNFFDTTPSHSIFTAMKHLPAALRHFGYLMTGVSMLADTWKKVGKYSRNIRSYTASGRDGIEEITVVQGKKEITVATTTLLVHEGIIPRTEFSRQLRLEHSWNPVQRYWYPSVDSDGRTSAPAIFMTGDGAFVHGGIASELKGELTALAIAEDLGKGNKQNSVRKKRVEKELACELLPRPFVDAMYQPRANMSEVDDEVIVCRCEEVKAGTIRELAGKGQNSPEMVKAVSRCGMGPCQGRMCSCSLAEIIASETGQNIQEVSPPTVRPPVRNIGLGELANMTLLSANLNDTESNR